MTTNKSPAETEEGIHDLPTSGSPYLHYVRSLSLMLHEEVERLERNLERIPRSMKTESYKELTGSRIASVVVALESSLRTATELKHFIELKEIFPAALSDTMPKVRSKPASKKE